MLRIVGTRFKTIRRYNSIRFVSRVPHDANSISNRRSTIVSQVGQYYPAIDQVRNKFNGKLMRISQFVEKFGSDTDLGNTRGSEYNLEGRITGIRVLSKGLFFMDLIQDDVTVQIKAYNKLVGLEKHEFGEINSWFKIGDYVSCNGFASRTPAGELTLTLTNHIEMLSPILQEIPNKLVDKGVINSNRSVNYLVNPDSKLPIIVKSQLIQAIRQFFIGLQFLEVQTPILSGEGTGANAAPFITHMKDTPVRLRVAPELWLKKLVIGGFDRVFEIGPNFRNEGIDRSHNPEFTSCEFYQAFTSLTELMSLTEELFAHLYKSLPMDHLKSFASPFPKYEFIPTIEQRTGIALPEKYTVETLSQYFHQIGLELPSNPTPVSLLDKLSEVYLESISAETPNTPIIIYNQPEIMSPLAKSSQGISHRFELFINGQEYVNAYEEENCPLDQYEKFKIQQSAKIEYNDDECVVPDWEYVKSMEYGLPPTGGWGCGIDRLAMLISGCTRIDQVLPFGNLRDVIRQ
ncbi:Lysine--tRNA ligase mitochondrial [Spathaspora sp. JA1]|nr:Lysine--tRNA ligase mitochondrial [Spathaspora sp. JA1]